MKILLSPSKEMNLERLEEKSNDIHFSLVYKTIDYIKSINQEDCFSIFKTKEDIYQQNQQINNFSKQALYLFDGIAFRQIEKDKIINSDDLLILNALYGYSKPSDYISPFRFDYTMKGSKTNRKEIYQEINQILENEDVVYNLASNEFSNGIKHHNIINFKFLIIKDNKSKQMSVDAKKMRGKLAQYICQGNNDFKQFTYNDYYYNDELSSSNEIVYTKKG